jgi:hypothetical protein
LNFKSQGFRDGDISVSNDISICGRNARVLCYFP